MTNTATKATPGLNDLVEIGRVQQGRAGGRGHLIARVIRDIKDLILGEGHDLPDNDALHLWDEFDGHVAGGTNWAVDYADGWTADSLVGVTGPEVPEQEVSF